MDILGLQAMYTTAELLHAAFIRASDPLVMPLRKIATQRLQKPICMTQYGFKAEGGWGQAGGVEKRGAISSQQLAGVELHFRRSMRTLPSRTATQLFVVPRSMPITSRRLCADALHVVLALGQKVTFAHSRTHERTLLQPKLNAHTASKSFGLCIFLQCFARQSQLRLVDRRGQLTRIS